MPRQAQHRPARDTRNARELADLRRQNDGLKRRAARLEEELEKAREARPRPKFLPEPAEARAAELRRLSPRARVEPEPEPEAIPKLDQPCPACGAKELRILRLGQGTWHVCRDCQWRGKQKGSEALL